MCFWESFTSGDLNILINYAFLIYKETVLLRRWERDSKLVLSNELMKVELPARKIKKADVSSVYRPSSE